MGKGKWYCLLLLVLMWGCQQNDLEPVGTSLEPQGFLGNYQGFDAQVREAFELVAYNAKSNPELLGIIAAVGKPHWDGGLTGLAQRGSQGFTASISAEDLNPLFAIPLVDDENRVVKGLLTFDEIDENRQMLRLFSEESFSILRKEQLEWEGVSNMYLLMVMAQRKVYGDLSLQINEVEVSLKESAGNEVIYVDEWRCVDWEIYFDGDPIPATGTNCDWYTIPIEVETVILAKDQPDDPGGGGGSNPASTDDADPCRLAYAMANDTTFINKLKELGLELTDIKEHGYIMRPGINDENRYEKVIGTATNPYIDIPLNNAGKLSGVVHTHFQGGSSIFTADDIMSLSALYDVMNDPKRFVFTVITSSGVYSLQVKDKMLFQLFGRNYNNFRTSRDQNFFTAKFTTSGTGGYGINLGQSAFQNELNFIEFLENENTGLRLFKGQLDSFDSWSRLSKTFSGNLKSKPCEE